MARGVCVLCGCVFPQEPADYRCPRCSGSVRRVRTYLPFVFCALILVTATVLILASTGRVRVPLLSRPSTLTRNP